MNWDYEGIRTVISILAFLGALASALYSGWSARNKRTRDGLAAVEKRVAASESASQQLRERVHLIERDAHYAPSQTDLQQINKTIADLHGDLREMSGRLTGINRAVDNMNNYLLKNDVD